MRAGGTYRPGRTLCTKDPVSAPSAYANCILPTGAWARRDPIGPLRDLMH